jgi:hypothetical protein
LPLCCSGFVEDFTPYGTGLSFCGADDDFAKGEFFLKLATFCFFLNDDDDDDDDGDTDDEVICTLTTPSLRCPASDA